MFCFGIVFKERSMECNKKSHSVYLLTYHIVFVTKYRRPVISDEIGDFMKNHAKYLCGRFDGKVLSIETDRDHMHLLVSLPPDIAPSKLVATLKTQLSKEVHSYYREGIEKQLWGDTFFYCNHWYNCHGKSEGIYRKPAQRRAQAKICEIRQICEKEVTKATSLQFTSPTDESVVIIKLAI